jgi:hypothetical protein
MKLARSVSEILRDHVTLEAEGIDRMYLNAVVPVLQRAEAASTGFSGSAGATALPLRRSWRR